MTESDEHTQKILDAVFDENISEILAEMESAPKKCGFLSEKFNINSILPQMTWMKNCLFS